MKRNWKVNNEMNRKLKWLDILLSIIFILHIINPFVQQFVVCYADADIVGGVGHSAWHNDSILLVHIINYEPRINWYDFQYNNSGTWVSSLNQKIEIDNNSEYRFIFNISSDQGWDDIDFINFTAWYDNGTESSTYNQTLGGNINLKMQYQNDSSTSNNPVFRFLWPRNEVTFTGYSERVVNDSDYGMFGLTEARNITVSFVPHCQFRYAPGLNTSWNTTETLVGNTSKYALYNARSWNFNVSVTDSGENITNNTRLNTWVANEFGVYAYTEIISVENPGIVGFPDANISAINGGSGNISIYTISNGNYSLSLNISDLQHKSYPSENISKSNLYVRGGNRTLWEGLSLLAYLYGGGDDGMPQYQEAEKYGNFINTSNIEYKCYIPMGQLAGDYSSPIHYYLKTQQ